MNLVLQLDLMTLIPMDHGELVLLQKSLKILEIVLPNAQNKLRRIYWLVKNLLLDDVVTTLDDFLYSLVKLPLLFAIGFIEFLKAL